MMHQHGAHNVKPSEPQPEKTPPPADSTESTAPERGRGGPEWIIAVVGISLLVWVLGVALAVR